ncbi:MAG: hypothetical protein ACAH82_01665 [Solirubrobacteraceae bacterium]
MTTHSTTADRRIATLTGFKPTGELHLGDYAGAIRPLARLAADEQRAVYLFVADLHALNGRPDPAALADRTQRLAAALLACGLDRPNVHLYRQSRVPAIARLTALLGNVTAKGLLNRPTPTRRRSPPTPKRAGTPITASTWACTAIRS